MTRLKPATQSKVLVAMSGGVDSSVVAYLLKAQGFEIVGMTMQLWGKDECSTAGSRLCCSVRDSMDARAVAKQYDFPHHILKLEKVFKSEVIDYFVESYKQGRTPNPCITCNDQIKFGELYKHADTFGAEFIATGHYARVGFDEKNRRHTLRCAADPGKDQSYMLFNLRQDQLARALFPLGDLTKDQVRALAREGSLRNADKPDSQDICFVRDRNKDNFLYKRADVTQAPGPIVDRQGVVLGQHKGLLGFTIGQREHIGITVGKPIYVVQIDIPNNRLVVGDKQDLLEVQFAAERVNWVSITRPEASIRAQVKIRSRHKPAPATVTPRSDGSAVVTFETPQSAITPGQAAVFYDGDLVLGGGWIANSGL